MSSRTRRVFPTFKEAAAAARMLAIAQSRSVPVVRENGGFTIDQGAVAPRDPHEPPVETITGPPPVDAAAASVPAPLDFPWECLATIGEEQDPILQAELSIEEGWPYPDEVGGDIVDDGIHPLAGEPRRMTQPGPRRRG